DGTFFRPLETAQRGAIAARFEALGIPRAAPVLITVGRVCARKGQDLVVRTLPDLVREYPDLRYVMVGIPEAATELRALAGELGVERSLLMLGKRTREEVLQLLNRADLC